MPGLDKNGHGVGSWCPTKWGNIRRTAVAAGMTLQQNCDTEESLSLILPTANRPSSLSRSPESGQSGKLQPHRSA